MIKVGIDALALYTPRYALDLATLAAARSISVDKYHVGLGQYVMSVPPPGEDIITMAANAAQQVLKQIDIDDIEMLLFATESGVDQSKAAGLYIHGLLNLPSRCRVVELKQACYSGTAGIQLALSYLRENPNKKVLLIASDIARYGLETTGESSQGAGAIALILSAYPRVIAFEPESGFYADNVMDFWRPNYSHEAFVDGKYSSKLYLTMLDKCWKQYQSLSNRQFADHAYFCYHTPVPRLVEKAHQYLLKINAISNLPDDVIDQQIKPSLEYARQLGNSYSASLYISLASLLDRVEENLTGKRIGFYSYGSGCVAEYFSGMVQAGYRDQLNTVFHQHLLSSRKLLNYDEYAAFYRFTYAENGSEQSIPLHNTGDFRLTKLAEHKRHYEAVPKIASSFFINQAHAKEECSDQASNKICVSAPGKLILSGEHSVVYGQPALAMAVNRYATVTLTKTGVPHVLFDLSDLSHHSRLSFDALHHLKEKIKQKYYRFIRGDYTIRDVLHKPFELAQFTLGMVADALNGSVPNGVKLHLQSNIPIGCGMGSSAATILSVLHAVSQYLHISLSEEMLYKLALEAENMQHGHSSGLDLRIAMNGGCIFMEGELLQTRALPNLPMYLINTGTPLNTTGQCVEQVAPYFKTGSLGDEFAAVTHAMDQAINQQSLKNMHQAIHDNHQLLIKIGVVPERVQAFISEIKLNGGAAKVCGAGAVSGDHAGIVLVASEDEAMVTSLSSRFGYNVIPIMGEMRGVHAA